MLNVLTKESFSCCIGQKFRVLDAYPASIDLELLEVSGNTVASLQQSERIQEPEKKPRREPFALVFRGPFDCPLPQRMYDLKNPSLGVLNGLFWRP